jgi:hypothetical protein
MEMVLKKVRALVRAFRTKPVVFFYNNLPGEREAAAQAALDYSRGEPLYLLKGQVEVYVP